MKLERQREAEMRRRQGMTKRTVLQSIWFIITGTAAYFVIDWLFANEYLTYGLLYANGVPRDLPEWGVFALVTFLLFFAAQIFFLLGYLIASPAGRQRRNRASMETFNREYANDDD